MTGQRNFGTPLEEETRTAIRQYAKIARDMKQGGTRACFIRVGRTNVGYLVYTYHERRRYVYLDDIEVFERYRRRGYAECALKLLEDEVVEKGAKSIGLNVFGDNLPAKKLYEKSGYSFAFHGMRKRL